MNDIVMNVDISVILMVNITYMINHSYSMWCHYLTTMWNDTTTLINHSQESERYRYVTHL